MAENRLKICINRIFRSPLSACKSKHQTNDVVAHTNRNRLIEFFFLKPRPSMTEIQTGKIKFPNLSPELNGRKCPPTSPVSSPQNSNSLCLIPKQRNKRGKNRKKGRLADKRYSGFEDLFPECRYNGLFSSDEDDDEEAEEGRRPSSVARSRRRREAEATAMEDSQAVVKRSSDPYSDFRTSMVEMIVENQIFAEKDLENLLQCFLSLNSHIHHEIIVQVFGEICEALLLE